MTYNEALQAVTRHVTIRDGYNGDTRVVGIAQHTDGYQIAVHEHGYCTMPEEILRAREVQAA